jgi:hypothetical protein
MAELIEEGGAGSPTQGLGGWPGTPRLMAAEEQLSEFRCARCGYGASCRIAPQQCPMCAGGAWEYGGRAQVSDRDQPLRRDELL